MSGRSQLPANSPLRGLERQLTYRTLRVLGAIAELGGSGSGPSNREVAAAAGIEDEGQTSRLLKRLQSLGLIEQEREPKPGEAYAWRLAARGEAVLRESGALGKR